MCANPPGPQTADVAELQTLNAASSRERSSVGKVLFPHPADEPTWFDVSTLSDADLHQISNEAKQFIKETTDAKNKEDTRRNANAAKKLQKTKDEQAGLDDPKVEAESTAVAKLQQGFAIKLMLLDACKTKIMDCRSRLGSTDEPESKPIKFPRTTAQEVWDRDQKGVKPQKKIGQPGYGPIYDTRLTAQQEYDQADNPEDSVFEDTRALSRKVNDTLSVALASEAKHMSEQKEILDRTAKDANTKASAADKAQRIVKPPLRAKYTKAMGEVITTLDRCNSDLKICHDSNDSNT